MIGFARGFLALALLSLPGALAPAAERSFDLEPDSPVDAELEAGLDGIVRELDATFGLERERRACGILEPATRRLAWVEPDRIFYGASVPKITIVLAYLESLREKSPGESIELEPEVRRELELVLKRSSNELAAKYSQIVGIEEVRRVQQLPRYRFYDAETGGGLWSGKHYGIDEPVELDPAGGYSHAATVRQCLRFFLFLEDGRLVDTATSALYRSLLAAPELEFHDGGFVHGLRGRDVTVLRKNGWWEDWHLDVARVEHAGKVYLIAGMVHDARGDEWLAELARRADRLLTGDEKPKPDVHDLILLETPEDFSRGEAKRGAVAVGPNGVELAARESDGGARETDDLILAEWRMAAIALRHPANELLPSWNVELGPESAIVFEVRVGRRAGELPSPWSPWLRIGDWGDVPATLASETRFARGGIDVDILKSDDRFDRVELRAMLCRAAGVASASSQVLPRARIERIAFCASDRTGFPHSERLPAANTPPPPEHAWKRRIDVPFRSQKVEDPAIAGRICSPTSVTMVLGYRGVEIPTADVASRLFDRAHDIYGNWNRAVEGAFTWGVPGYLTRFSRWEDVEREIARGQPLIASIRVEPGELPGAPYEKTAGHLLVITGFDPDGNVLVNDPAAKDATTGLIAHSRERFERVWMRSGGTSYVLLPRGAEGGASSSAPRPSGRSATSSP